jgi:hypothetical protein
MANKPEEVHSPYGGSQAHRWIRCPGSIKLIESLPGEGAISGAASRGTAMHEVAAICLKTVTHRLTKDELKGIAAAASIDTGYLCNAEDIDIVHAYVDYVFNIMQEGCNKVYVEHPVSLSSIDPLIRGTLDIGILDEIHRKLYVGDLKTGHIPVSAIDNEQLMMYAAGLIETEKLEGRIDTVAVFIAQPNLFEWENNYTEVQISDLKTWVAGVLEPAYKRTKIGDFDNARSFNPGAKQCQWCRAKGVCSARAESILPAPLKAGQLPAPTTLDPEQIADILDKADEFAAWLKDVRAYAEEGVRLQTLTIPGYGIVEKAGRKSRSWAAGAAESLSVMYGNDVFDLKSPAAVEKIVGKDGKSFINSLVISTPGSSNFVLTKTDEPSKVGAVEDFLGK